MSEKLTVLVAARDEDERIGETVAALAAAFPQATIVVADDGSRDRTAAVAEAAGARVITVPRRGEGAGADGRGAARSPTGACSSPMPTSAAISAPLTQSDADLAIAAFRRRSGDGLGLAKRASRDADQPVGAGSQRASRSRASAASRRRRAGGSFPSRPASASRRG